MFASAGIYWVTIVCQVTAVKEIVVVPVLLKHAF